MIYFDAGATTLEKPAAVGRAMARAAHTMSSPGRGSYPASHLAGETAYLCRQEAAELLGVPQPENVVITGSATHGLNLAIRSLLGPGDRVVISGYEHNAVTRPLHAIPGLSVTVLRMEVPCCGGLEMAARRALEQCGRDLPWQVCTVHIDGTVTKN